MAQGFYIQAKTDYGSLQHFLDSVSEKAVWEAARKGGNTTLRRMQAEANRRVRAQRNLKQRFVKNALRLQFPRRRGSSSRQSLQWQMNVRGDGVGLINYSPRETKRGVSVNVAGQRQLIEGAFIATMDSGHTGVFRRTGTGRLPIEELFSTRVSDVFLNTGFIPELHQFVQQTFDENWRRLVDREIERARNRSLRRSRSRR